MVACLSIYAAIEIGNCMCRHAPPNTVIPCKEKYDQKNVFWFVLVLNKEAVKEIQRLVCIPLRKSAG